MIRNAKDLSPDQISLLEGLLGRAIAESEQISIQSVPPSSVPDWLQSSWESATQLGLDQLSMEEIDAEIAAARQTRNERGQPSGQ
jgi:hypothetical protein